MKQEVNKQKIHQQVFQKARNNLKKGLKLASSSGFATSSGPSFSSSSSSSFLGSFSLFSSAFFPVASSPHPSLHISILSFQYRHCSTRQYIPTFFSPVYIFPSSRQKITKSTLLWLKDDLPPENIISLIEKI